MSTTQASATQQDRRLRAFLCHASGDKPAVRDLYYRLKADGFAPWLDEEDLLPGQDWREEIPAAVRACDIVVVCLSQKSISKEGYLQKEIREALSVAEEKPEGTIFIIPARLEPVDVPKSLGQWQWANLFQEDGYERLTRALRLRANVIGLTVTADVAAASAIAITKQAKVEMAELRPNVVPVKYIRVPGRPALGLEIANDGDSAAYEVTIPDVKLGTAIVSFQADCPRLAPKERAFWRVLIQLKSRSVRTGNELMDEMLTQGIAELDVMIQYKDRERWYATICKLEINVSARETGGISVHFLRQELIPRSSRSGETWIKAGSGGPEIMLVWDLPDEAKNFAGLGLTDKQLIMENTGNVDAHDVVVRDVFLTPKIAATFKLIPRLARGEKKPITPILTGQVPDNHQGEFLMVMYAAGDAPQYSEYDSTGTRLIAVKFPITVSFKDYGEEYYQVHFEFAMDTVRHTEQIRYTGRDKLRRRLPG